MMPTSYHITALRYTQMIETESAKKIHERKEEFIRQAAIMAMYVFTILQYNICSLNK